MMIRKATPADANFIATYLLLAMEDIVYTFIGERNALKAKEFMLHFASRENNQYSWQNCWVVELDDQVVAAVNVYNGALLQELRQPVIEYIGPHWNFEEETGAGEYYIDSLGVHPGYRGQGIGAKILQFLIDEYDGETLGLLVDEDNPNAKRLYLKLGFKSVGLKDIFGKRMEHLQFNNKYHSLIPG
jgi:ribosomal protein S18 acetylase RimI-like enzyme